MASRDVKSIHKNNNYLNIIKLVQSNIGIFNHQERQLHVFRLVSLPVSVDNQLFLDSMLNSQFMLYHEFSTASTFLITDNKCLVNDLETVILGLRFNYVPSKDFSFLDSRYLVGFNINNDRLKSCLPLEDMYSILKNCKSGILVSFVPTDILEVSRVKDKVEDMLSRREIRITNNFGNKSYPSVSGSAQRELYYDSDERRLLLSILETLNEAVARNGCSYKISFIVHGDDKEKVYNYLRQRLFILEDYHLRTTNLGELYKSVRIKDAVPFSYEGAARILGFTDSVKKAKIITTSKNVSNVSGGVSFGFYLDGSVYETTDKISTEVSTLNLGTLITGLPGSGKTFAAMNIINQIIDKRQTKIVIIAPTKEWSAFGSENNMKVVRLDGYGQKINFFRCNDKNVARFYENLAMLMAHASNAGPYKNSIEKCLLSAFNKVYSVSTNPDPTDVYEEIEEAVIEQHGRRSGVGVKYTKHGENIRAALENLRLMLLKPQFAYSYGVELEQLISDGVVFDLSNVSNNMKPFYYALVLNQIYASADSFDMEGNEELRLFICLEEAQLVFDNSEERSAATLDLRQRIQDFRKKGIGIMLITHNVTDIDFRIRRLCQTKLYFRQSADIVKYAANDLILEGSLIDDLGDKLKTLEHRVCVLNYIGSQEGLKNPATALFIKIPEHSVGRIGYSEPNLIGNLDETTIRIIDNGKNPINQINIELWYVGERIYNGRIDNGASIIVKNLLEDKRYKLFVLGKSKKQTKTFNVIGGKENIITVDSTALS